MTRADAANLPASSHRWSRCRMKQRRRPRPKTVILDASTTKRWLHQRMSGGTKLPTGRRFGSLRSLGSCQGQATIASASAATWLPSAVQLEPGSVTSCGRCRPAGFQPPLVETPEPRKKVASLPAGRQFSHLTTTEVVTSRGYYCQCECGNLVVVRRFQLENGSAASCGRCRPAHFRHRW